MNRLGLALALAALPAVAAAQATSCEIHVWPTQDLRSNTVGFWEYGQLSAMPNRKKGDLEITAQMARVLDGETQVERISSMDFPGILGAPSTKIVKHNEFIDRKTVRKVKTRRSDSKSPCYSEILVVNILYSKQPLSPRTMAAAFSYRNFGGAETIARDFLAAGGVELHKFPAKPEDDAAAADAELVDGFREIVAQFAAQVSKKPR